MKRILKNKRGIAMESALLFMTVVTCLCMLLTTGMTLLHTSVKTDVKQYQNRLVLDQIGEYFVSMGKDAFDEKMSESYADYTYEIKNENNTLTLKNGERVILYIEKNGNKATTWRYSAP